MYSTSTVVPESWLGLFALALNSLLALIKLFIKTKV